jgi:hypothetical protein
VTYEERQAWIALWTAVFGEPPPVQPEREATARILVEHLPPMLPYELKACPPSTPSSGADGHHVPN